METPTVKLRPLGVVEILDQAIRIYRSNFWKFIAIIAVVQIPIHILNTLSSLMLVSSPIMQNQGNPSNYTPGDSIFDMLGPGYFAGIGGTCILAIISLLLVQGAATAALTRAVTDHYLGIKVGIVDAYRKIGPFWLRLAGAILLAGLCSMGLMIWLLVPCAGWFTGMGMMTFFSLVLVPLIAPIIVLEQQDAGRSIRRAWDLARRRFWWVIGFVALLYIFNQVIVTGPVTVANLVIQFLTRDMLFGGDSSKALAIQTITQSLVSMTFTLIYLPLQSISMTLLYFDLRVRTEGFDLALQAEGMQSEPIEIIEIVAHAPMPETTPLVTGTEMGYFVLLSIGAGIVFFALAAVGAGAGFLSAFGAMGP